MALPTIQAKQNKTETMFEIKIPSKYWIFIYFFKSVLSEIIELPRIPVHIKKIINSKE